MKQSEGWDIELRKKIKNSLSVKVFLWVFSALTICSMLIYGIVLTVIPKQYQVTSDKQLDTNTEILVSKLQDMRYDEAVSEIYNFCIQNNSMAKLSDDNGALTFGEIKSEALMVATSSIATTVTFSDSKTEYTLVVSSLSQTADIILNLMLRFLPVVFAIILLLSSLSAFICSRVIVSPIAKISQISKRMTSLDMTWKCDIESNDEIGVLASSLNTMASRLQETMEELTNANNQLTDDVEKFKSLEEGRRNFFAAVSHELKTPLTILKGQIENMILGFGDYQNHEKYLPEALKATEDIEHLVKEIIAISKVESMDLADTLQEVSLKQTVNDTIQAILLLAQDKNIQIHEKINTDMVLYVNPNLWNKVLSNIIGNAVRHSPYSEDVFVTLQSSENGNTLVIENTGVSIPEADLRHMFTPFYRADKSRNKATGGNGLGLYIVKTILDLHGMTYLLRNTEQGVAFFLNLN
ncbi:MAG: HAMP domain-containing histidine kinase [Lachnospiraceae bacterium]|nr:HAMP domain-containing histidine kinase [Lachnospiraceae bacterium]